MAITLTTLIPVLVCLAVVIGVWAVFSALSNDDSRVADRLQEVVVNWIHRLGAQVWLRLRDFGQFIDLQRFIVF